MSRIKFIIIVGALFLSAPAFADGILTSAASEGTLPAVGSEGNCLLTSGGVWTAGACPGAGTGAPTDATYITQTANGTLTNEQALGSLATGCMGSTTTTGVVATRTITGTSNEISVANGDCSGNPTLSLPSTVDLGAAKLIQAGTDPADTGRLRLPNNESICFEANPTGTDLCITLNASNEFVFNAPVNITGTAGPLLLTGVVSPSAPATAEQWYFYADSVDDLPKYIYNGGTEQTFYTTANPQTTITGNAGTATALAANGSNCSAGSYPLGVDASGAAESCTSVASDTVTLTNKTLDAEGTGNVITLPKRIWLPAAGCNNATAGSIWDLPTTNPAVAACVTGTNTQKGVLDFADGANTLSAQLTYKLPSTWTGTVDANIKWFSATTTGDVVWQIATICVADAETDDPAFNTASTVTDTAKGTTNQTNDAAITGVTTTGCAAGELMHLKILRDPTNGADTHAATARLIGVELVIREAI